MKRSSFLLILHFIVFSVFAQEAHDKVTKALDEFMEAENPSVSQSILQNVENLVDEVPDSTRASFYLSMGICLGQMGKVDSSFLYLDRSEEVANTSSMNFIKVKINNTRGLVYMVGGDYEKSLAAYQEAMNLAEGNDEPRFLEALRKIYGNSGGIFYQLNQYNRALEMTRKALSISEQLDDNSGRAYNHLRLALVLNDLDSLQKGIDHLTKASEYLKTLGDTTTLLYAENTLGSVLEKQGQVEDATVHYKKAHQLALAIGDQEEVAFTLLSIASIYLKTGAISQAEAYSNRALKFASVNNFPNSIKRAHDILYQCATDRGNYRLALQHRNSHIALSDSISGADVKEKVAELETKYETVKKEAEIDRLTLEGQLKDANLATARNAQYAIALGAGCLIIILLGYISFRYKGVKAEREAQKLRIEAFQKRLIELNATPPDLTLDFEELNSKLNTQLSDREFEALVLSLDGKTNAEIADELFISNSTVKFHLRNTYSKLGVQNRKEAFKFILQTS